MPLINDGLTLAELERFSIATLAASDPGALMDAATLKFQAMEGLFDEGDTTGVARAARSVANDCLRLCVVPAADEQSSGEKARFISILSKWAWPRWPALAAVTDAAVGAECRTWGDQVCL